ncbi:MAG: sugar lactone lactonase YvrE [Parasphingorhabdus sp.]|jgi:sugar lactone lactonase YvrE
MPIPLSQLKPLGRDLNRPECVLTHQSGLTFASDWTANGGVSIIRPDHSIQRIQAKHETALRPNGIALEPDGCFLLAHLGANDGGVFRLNPDGEIKAVLRSLNGQPLPPTNFVTIDNNGLIWITVSTRTQPRSDAYCASVRSGFIVQITEQGARIVADDLGYTNECLVSPDGATLFVNETFARRLSAFDIKNDLSLGPRRTVTTFGAGTYPDGLCLSTDGSLWVTSIVSNRVIRVYPGGRTETVIEDCNTEHVDWAENAYQSETMGRPHLDVAKGELLKNISCLAFGGDNLSTGYLGCLLGDTIQTVDLPVSGVPLSHWDAPLEKLLPFVR